MLKVPYLYKCLRMSFLSAAEPSDSVEMQHVTDGRRFLRRQLEEVEEASSDERRHTSSMMACR